jgi:hypothetical protein
VNPRVAVVDRQHDGRDPHVGERGIGHVIAHERAKLFENETLNTFVPVTGTFFSSHDKRLPRRRRPPRKTTSRSACAAAGPSRHEDDEARAEALIGRCQPHFGHA